MTDTEFNDEAEMDMSFADGKDIAGETQVISENEAVPQEVTKPVIVMSTLPITGEPRVDDALSRLTDLQGLPVHEHAEVFEDVQRRLHETLADISTQ